MNAQNISQALAYRARTESLLHNAEAQMAALQERNKVLTEKLQSTERSTNLSVSGCVKGDQNVVGT